MRQYGLLVVAIFAFGHCTPLQADELRVGVQLEPPNLDPTSGAAAAIDEIVYSNVFEGLTGIAADGTVVPRLAKSWQISDNGRHYRFFLQPNVRFHDGTSFDAHDVKFSFDRLLAPDSTNAQRPLFASIQSVRVVDTLTVDFVLSEAVADFTRYLAWGDAVIVAPESATTNATRPIGTGPFRFERWRKGVSIELRRAEYNWRSTPASDRPPAIRFVVIPDPTAAYAALVAGEIDGFPNFPAPELLQRLQADDRFRVQTGTGEGETILAINNAVAPFTDIRVRRALSHAINRQALIDGPLFGYGQLIGSHFPPHHPAYIDLSKRYAYDPARARELLSQAGVQAGLEVSLRVPPPSYARRAAELIVADLTAVGLTVRVENLEWAQWLGRVFADKDFELTIVAHTEPLDYDIYARQDYYFGYQSPAMVALVEELRVTFDNTRRLALLAQIQQRIADDAVNVFLFQGSRTGVWDKAVDGVWRNAPLQANDLTDVHLSARTVSESIDSSETLPSVLAWLVGLLVAVGLIVMARHTGRRYLLRRLATLVVTLLAASVIVFGLIELAPGDAATFMMGLNADPTALARLRADLGLDQPAPVRYIVWLGGMLQGDFGESFTYQVPVLALMLERLSVSFPLTLLALAIAAGIALPAGLLAAEHRGRWIDQLINGFTQIGIAVPNFWVASILVLVFAIVLGWLPVGGFPGWDAGLGAGLKALLLPAIALAIPQAAILARVLRAGLNEALDQDFVRTARSKGLNDRTIVRRHALRHALLPVLTILGLQCSFLLAGGIIIENVFYLPGLGRLVFQAIAQRDLVVVQGVVMLLVLATVSIAFIVDLAYAVADPRLRGHK